MGVMGWGKRRQTARAPTVESTARGLTVSDLPDSEANALHFCCICGALLGSDPEDEIDGEGWGKDICGDCNRTRNDDAITMGW